MCVCIYFQLEAKGEYTNSFKKKSVEGEARLSCAQEPVSNGNKES